MLKYVHIGAMNLCCMIWKKINFISIAIVPWVGATFDIVIKERYLTGKDGITAVDSSFIAS